MEQKKINEGYVPPKLPVKPSENDNNRGFVPPKPPVKPPEKQPQTGKK